MKRHVTNRKALWVFQAAMVLTFGGCRTPIPGLPDQWYIIEDFERCGLWSIDSANNYGEVEYVTEDARHGRYALKCTFFDDGRGNTTFRKEVDYNLSLTDRLYLDVLSPEGRGTTMCALAFRTATDRFFETRPVKLRPGWNVVEFRLDHHGMKAGTDFAVWKTERARITRLMILVFPGGNKRGFVVFDGLRARHPGINRDPRPVLLGVGRIPEFIRQWQPVELLLEFSGKTLWKGKAPSGRDTWTPVEVVARLTSPDGQIRENAGFLKEVVGGQTPRLVYAVRFAAPLPGRWHVAVAYRAERQWQAVSEQFFSVEEAKEANGMVETDPQDPAFFRFASGKFFYAIGQNVCWAGNYQPYLEAMRWYGGNLMRVWICPWNFPLLDDGLDVPNLSSAAGLDQVFQQAWEKGIYIQLVLAYHGWFTSDWEKNPFNAARGGPCTTPEDFWTDESARAKFKAYLDYCIRRWSAWPNLFAWELMNEVDLVPWVYSEDVIRWHEEMSSHVKKNDPYHHLVTTSTASPTMLTEIWRLPAIDFVTSHLYTTNPARDIPDTWRQFASLGKPYFVAEFGRGTKPGDDQTDPEGRHLHHALWLAAMTPSAGNLLPWWWDTFVAPNRLERHLRAVARFMQGEDRRGLELRRWTAEVRRHERAGARFHGLVARDRVYGFVFDPETVQHPGPLAPLPVLSKLCRLRFEEMEDGIYRFEIWNTCEGEVLYESEVECREGRLILPVPATSRDLAFKAVAKK